MLFHQLVCNLLILCLVENDMKLTRTGYGIKALLLLLCFGLQNAVLDAKGKYVIYPLVYFNLGLFNSITEFNVLNVFLFRAHLKEIYILAYKINSIDKNTARIFWFELKWGSAHKADYDHWTTRFSYKISSCISILLFVWQNGFSAAISFNNLWG